jgi:hypothetical protein
VVGILAGRSYVGEPGSLSAHYQEYFRSAVSQAAQARSLAVLDLAAVMRAQNSTATATWFFPHDGHLTPSGHRFVADQIIRALPPGQ